MAMTNRHNQKRDNIIIYTLNDLVPQAHSYSSYIICSYKKRKDQVVNPMCK